MLPWRKIVASLFFLLVFLSTQLVLLSSQANADLNGSQCTGDVSYSNESTPINGSVTVTGDGGTKGTITKTYLIHANPVVINNVSTYKNQFTIDIGNPFFPPSQAGLVTIKTASFAIDKSDPTSSTDDTPTKVFDRATNQYVDSLTFSQSEQVASGDTKGNKYVCDKLQSLLVQKVTSTPDTWGCFYADGWDTGQVYKIAPDNNPKYPDATYSTQAAAQADCGTFIIVDDGGNYVCSGFKKMSDADVKAAANKFHTRVTSGLAPNGKQSCVDYLAGHPQNPNTPGGTTITNKYSISGDQCVPDATGDYATIDDCKNAIPKQPTPTPTPPQPPCNEPEDIVTTGTNSGDIKFTNCYGVATGLGIDIYTDPTLFVKSVFEILLSVSGGIAIFLVIRSGYQMMTSSGDPERIKNAKEILSSAIIGLLFIIFSLVILEVIGVDILQIPGLNH